MPSTFWKALKGILQTPAENPSTGCLHRCSRPLLSASWAPMTAPLAGTGYGGRLYTVSERSDTHVHALTYRKGPSAATPGRQPLMEAGDWRRCLCLNSSHGRVPRVETVRLLLQKHLGNGRDTGSSILITSCGSQRGRSRRATTLAA